MILIIIAGVVVLLFWNDTLKVREHMLQRCRRNLRDMDLQLLDETVALDRIRLRRNARGQLVIARVYHFEFSSDGEDRWLGRAVLLGHVLQTLQIDRPEGTTVVQSASPSEHVH